MRGERDLPHMDRGRYRAWGEILDDAGAASGKAVSWRKGNRKLRDPDMNMHILHNELYILV